jgi:cytidine deaminase
VALFKAISEGYRSFETVAVVTQGSPAAAPCGSCRQMLKSWSVERVLIAGLDGDVEVVSLDSLLPRFFHLSAPVPTTTDDVETR